MKKSKINYFFIKLNALLFICIGLALPFSQSQAANCGGNNQRPCTIWERVPSCNGGLKEDFSKGKCVSKAPPKLNCGKKNGTPCKVWQRVPSCDRGLVENFIKNQCLAENPLYGRASYVIKNGKSFISQLQNIHSCLNQKNRLNQFKHAVDKQNMNAAQSVVNQCISRNMLNLLRQAPVPDMSQAANDGFSIISSAHAGVTDVHNMLTIGVSAGAMVIAGINGEAGIAIPLTGTGPAHFYVTGDWALGFGANVGASIVVGASTDRVIRGDSESTAIVYSGKAIAGASVAVSYSGKNVTSIPSTYTGTAVGVGVGAGLEHMTTHRSATHIF